MRTQRAAVLVLVLALAVAGTRAAEAAPPGPVEVESEDLRPGVVAQYRSLVDPAATLARVEAKPAFVLGGSSPHPRIPPGPFEVIWTGFLLMKESAPVTFDAVVGGSVSVTVDGTVVLNGNGKTAGDRLTAEAAFERRPGFYRIVVRYRSVRGVPARLQIGWAARTFAREPVPAWLLKHLPTEVPIAAVTEQRIAGGREAVARLGCARCHPAALPAVTDPPPGPDLADIGRRLTAGWVMHWLDDPGRVRSGARMPGLFSNDRTGFVERWLLTEYLIGAPGDRRRAEAAPPGDHRRGRQLFISLACTACHFLPDQDRAVQPAPDRWPLIGLGDRFGPEDLETFLGNPHARYPDGRMPRLPLVPAEARDLAAFLLLWSKPSPPPPLEPPPSPAEVAAVQARLGVRNRRDAALGLVREKGCSACHPGLGNGVPVNRPLSAKAVQGCLTGRSGPRYTLDESTRLGLQAYLGVARTEIHPSPVDARRRLLDRSGCFRCHQHDSDRAPPLERINSTLGGSQLETIPFQRTPRLNGLLQKYTARHVMDAVREGVTGLRPPQFTYRMPAFGPAAEEIVQALHELDGELPDEPAPPEKTLADPTAGTVAGSELVGFQGYACVSCHVWNGRMLSDSDPGAVGPDLTRVAGRIRRDWFDRFLEDPARSHPGTPMPGVFPRGKPVSIRSVLDGDAGKQKDALWGYFAAGAAAPSPKPLPPLPITAPAAGETVLVAQIPIRLTPTGPPLESVCVLTATGDLLIYDLARATPHSTLTGAQILRHSQGRHRWYTAAGTRDDFASDQPPLLLSGAPRAPRPVLLGYDRRPDGVRLRWRLDAGTATMTLDETLRFITAGAGRHLERTLEFTGVPGGGTLTIQCVAPKPLGTTALNGTAAQETGPDGRYRILLGPDDRGIAAAVIRIELPPPRPVPPWAGKPLTDAGRPAGSLERPGYTAIAYPRPQTVSGEDRVMPGAVAVSPRDGRVFVASLKTGELFVLNDPTGDGRSARFDTYGHGLFQDALSMHAGADGLYLLHRRNLTRITESRLDGIADRFDRVVALPQGVADSYDYGYGLAREPDGAFVFTHAPHADRSMIGAGSALRLRPGSPPEVLAYGFRNPLGWCTSTKGEVFFTDNQGEWVATNKLCHLVPGRYYGFPNTAQLQATRLPAGRAAVWVPYDWARSVNGIACDTTGGKFGPFAGQFFLAELMFGGAIVRADVEEVNGRYQGCCFPFWGKGLLGPLTLAFDPRGPLYVGSITEPGWMAQPDRGGLYRIDFNGATPFELKTIRARPRGFRVLFTLPVTTETAADPASYQVEHYRYEYTGAYGSPELDRTRVKVERVEVAADGLSAELFTTPLLHDRVYGFSAAGVWSRLGDRLVHPTGVYTVNEVPADAGH